MKGGPLRHRCSCDVLCLMLELMPASFAEAQDARVTVPLESGWRFLQSDGVNGAQYAGFDDSAWSTVEVPHTWNRLGNFGIERLKLGILCLALGADRIDVIANLFHDSIYLFVWFHFVFNF